jgi:chromosomal replication initiation ATPase DnaA
VNEPIGIYAEQTAKREALVSRLSPQARHQAFPRLYARPLPPRATADQAALDRIQREKDALIREVANLRDTVAALQAQLTTPTVLMARRIAERKNAPADVITAFLLEINALRDAGEDQWTIAHLTSARRARSFAMPRHVCIWLVRQLCTQVSLPTIGKHFGNRDHTSCMHACVRAPHWLLIDPKMKLVADAVLLRFGGSAT